MEGVVLQIGMVLLEFLDAVLGGVGEKQVADGRYQSAFLPSVPVSHKAVLHGHEAFHFLFLQIGFCLQFSAEGGAHGKPDDGICRQFCLVCFCIHFVIRHSFGSPNHTYIHCDSSNYTSSLFYSAVYAYQKYEVNLLGEDVSYMCKDS